MNSARFIRLKCPLRVDWLSPFAQFANPLRRVHYAQHATRFQRCELAKFFQVVDYPTALRSRGFIGMVWGRGFSFYPDKRGFLWRGHGGHPILFWRRQLRGGDSPTTRQLHQRAMQLNLRPAALVEESCLALQGGK